MTSRKELKNEPLTLQLRAQPSCRSSTEKASLFGWLQGTVTSASDLTEPADPEWAEHVDDECPPVGR